MQHLSDIMKSMKLAIKLIVLVLLVIIGLEGYWIWSNHQPKIMAAIVEPTVTPTPTPIILSTEKTFNLINDYRVAYGLKALEFDEALCEFAYLRLKQIHTNWSHEGFVPEVNSYINATYKGENLISGYRTDKEQVDAWVLSPTHLKNIVDHNYTRTCIATDNYNNLTYTVQIFASY